MWLELLTFVVIGTIFFYRWATKYNDFFKKRNVPHDKPKFLFGSGRDIMLRRKTILQALCDFYHQHDGIVFGGFDNRDPILLIRDPQLIKHIMIKDFDHFVNRRSFFGEGSDNLFGNSLFLMENDKWRDMRSTLSPAFTGSKMRQMFQLILETVVESMAYLKDQQRQKATDDQDGFEMDVKDFTTRLTNDIIATTAFGLQVNSFRDENNEFYVKAKKIISFPAWQQIKMMFVVLMPKIANFFKIDMFGKEFTDYFMRLVLDTMQYRKENNIHRPDMIHLLMEARGMIPTDIPKSHYREWSDLDVVAQCFVFFFAALEPSSAVMSFAAHELMEYPDVQERLFEEIQECDKQLEGKLVTYELLQKMPYMDMVVAEVLRKWPITLFTDRTCTKDYEYESPETGERIEIKKGDMLRVAMCAIQRDPKYYENPDVLNPERFSEENKANIDSGTYLPFGLGPRNCIGTRFALLQIKAFLYYLVRDYRLEASPKTCLPMELCKSNVQLKPKTGFWLQFKPRQY